MDSSNESTALLYLFNKNLLNGVNNKEPEFVKENENFWKSFKETIRVNKCGLDGKQRVLFIIAKNLGYREIQKNLLVNLNIIH